jgi:hypothetical protein
VSADLSRIAPDGADSGVATDTPNPVSAGLELVATRSLVEDDLNVRFALAAGDRALVASGETVAAGAPLIQRLRDPRLDEIPVLPEADRRRPGDRWSGELPARIPALHPHAGAATGELLFETEGRWRIATGERTDQVDAPADGVVREVRPGIGIALQVRWHALKGAFAIGGPTRGRLEIASEASGELRAGGLNVGRAGTILVVGSRVDAEALTRARAMDVRGVIVAALPGKEQRDFGASEARQRAALHALPPFGLLVLDGIIRRPIASTVMHLLRALEGSEVAIVADPPALLFRENAASGVEPDRVRIRHGPSAGREGRWLGLAGSRRFGAGTHLEAGLVHLDDGETLAVPLADLERYV